MRICLQWCVCVCIFYIVTLEPLSTRCVSFFFFLRRIFIADKISISMYIMCVILCLFSVLSRRVGALQISIIDVNVCLNMTVCHAQADIKIWYNYGAMNLMLGCCSLSQSKKSSSCRSSLNQSMTLSSIIVFSTDWWQCAMTVVRVAAQASPCFCIWCVCVCARARACVCVCAGVNSCTLNLCCSLNLCLKWFAHLIWKISGCIHAGVCVRVRILIRRVF